MAEKSYPEIPSHFASYVVGTLSLSCSDYVQYTSLHISPNIFSDSQGDSSNTQHHS